MLIQIPDLSLFERRQPSGTSCDGTIEQHSLSLFLTVTTVVIITIGKRKSYYVRIFIQWMMGARVVNCTKQCKNIETED